MNAPSEQSKSIQNRSDRGYSESEAPSELREHQINFAGGERIKVSEEAGVYLAAHIAQ